MRKISIIIGVLVVAVLGALVVITSFISSDLVKSRLTQAVKESTGRDLNIQGEFEVNFFPKISLSAEGATLSNRADGVAEHMVEIEKLKLGLAVLPLLRRDIRLTEFILENPVINLEVDGKNQSNWDFVLTMDEQTSSSEPIDETVQESSSISNLSLGDVRIVNGSVSYLNKSTPAQYDVSSVNMTVSLPDLGSEFNAKGSLVYNGEKLDLDIALENPSALADGGQSPLSLALSSKLVDLGVAGSISNTSPLKLKGKSSLDVPSMRKLASWLDQDLPSQKGFGPLSISGNLDVNGQVYAFKNANIQFDKMKGTGALSFNTTSALPHVSATLDLDKLDLRPYMSEANGESEAQPNSSSEIAPWSSTKIDFSPLKSFNADFNFSTKKFYYQRFEVDQSVLIVSLKNGSLVANLSDLNLYKGKGSAKITLNTSRSIPQLTSTFDLTGIDSGPLIVAATARELFTGTGDMGFTLSSTGRSQAELMKNLSGNGRLLLNDGEVVGADLVGMLRLISAFKPQNPAQPAADAQTTDAVGSKTGQDQVTKFSQMGGTFTVSNGVLNNQDFKLLNEALSLTGNGRVDIAGQKIKFRMKPGARQDDGGLRVSLIIEGPWNDIKFRPDFEQILKDQIQKGLGINPEDPVGSLFDLLLKETRKPKNTETQ